MVHSFIFESCEVLENTRVIWTIFCLVLRHSEMDNGLSLPLTEKTMRLFHFVSICTVVSFIFMICCPCLSEQR